MSLLLFTFYISFAAIIKENNKKPLTEHTVEKKSEAFA